LTQGRAGAGGGAPPGISIRPERPGDEAAIRAVIDAAFAPSVEEGEIVEALRGSTAWRPELALVAVDDSGRIVGQCVTSVGDLVDDGGSPVGQVLTLGPIAVAPERQGEGIGGELIRSTAAVAAAAGWPAIVLLGHADYYPRFGFEPARPLGLTPPQPWSDEHWLALRLPAWTPGGRATVRYPSAFGID
jgi:putative acetyltransferase